MEDGSGSWCPCPPVGVIENWAEGLSAEGISGEVYSGLVVERARRIIEYAMAHATHPNPA
jgi:hypothetical protein